MLGQVCSAAVNGLDAYPVEVDVNAGHGGTVIVIVGLPDAAVKESRDRVTTALINSGFNFTLGRTTINLAPADVRKEGPSFDFPIAIGMVVASEQIETELLEKLMIVGEPALDGVVRPVKGVLPISLRARVMLNPPVPDKECENRFCISGFSTAASGGRSVLPSLSPSKEVRPMCSGFIISIGSKTWESAPEAGKAVPVRWFSLDLEHRTSGDGLAS